MSELQIKRRYYPTTDGQVASVNDADVNILSVESAGRIAIWMREMAASKDSPVYARWADELDALLIQMAQPVAA